MPDLTRQPTPQPDPDKDIVRLDARLDQLQAREAELAARLQALPVQLATLRAAALDLLSAGSWREGDWVLPHQFRAKHQALQDAVADSLLPGGAAPRRDS